MTMQTSQKFRAEFKAKVALDAIKNQKTRAVFSHQFKVNAITISKWKAEPLECLHGLFKGNHLSHESESSVEMEKLYAQIYQLKLENVLLKKKVRGNCG